MKAFMAIILNKFNFLIIFFLMNHVLTAMERESVQLVPEDTLEAVISQLEQVDLNHVCDDLLSATRDNCLPCARFWLMQGVDPCKMDSSSRTALHFAATLYYKRPQNVQCEIVGLLIDRGADPNQKDSDGNTPLHNVLHYNSRDIRIEVVEVLLMRGAHPNIQNNYQSTPLHWICKNTSYGGDWKPIIKLLFDHGADSNSENEFGTPLYLALMYKNYELIRPLIGDRVFIFLLCLKRVVRKQFPRPLRTIIIKFANLFPKISSKDGNVYLKKMIAASQNNDEKDKILPLLNLSDTYNEDTF